MRKNRWSIIMFVLLWSVAVASAQSAVVFEDDLTSDSLTPWELFIPGTQAEWEYHEEDNGFLRAPMGVENATAQREIPTVVLGPTSNVTKIIVELDYRLHRYSPNGYFKLYLLNKDTRDGYGIHVYAGIMDWKYQFINIYRDSSSTLKLTPGYQEDQTSEWITIKFVIERNGSLWLYRDGMQVASGRIASGDLTGVPLGEFNQLVIVDRHNYAGYDFGRIRVSVEEE
ncbi:MAG TPA: hypothetical protein GXX57_06735 [Firmicutes bacterium]|nr:hypothetical protein [Bacillota bacterium]